MYKCPVGGGKIYNVIFLYILNYILYIYEKDTRKEKELYWVREWEEKARDIGYFLPLILLFLQFSYVPSEITFGFFPIWTMNEITNTFDNNMFFLRKRLF